MNPSLLKRELLLLSSVCVHTQLHSRDVSIKQLLPADVQQLMVNVKTTPQMAHSYEALYPQLLPGTGSSRALFIPS
jgi:hypothetical protein